MTDQSDQYALEENFKWSAYVEKMQDQKPEEYLAGDLEGYRRGYGDGRDAAKGKPADFKLTIIGTFVVALLAGAIGFALGVGAFAL